MCMGSNSFCKCIIPAYFCIIPNYQSELRSMKNVACVTSFFLIFITSACNSLLLAQERQLVKAKDDIRKADFNGAKERLDKYAEKAGTGAEYQYIMYLLVSRQAKTYQEHVNAYEIYQRCVEAYQEVKDPVFWCEEIQLCDTMLANEMYHCYMAGFEAIDNAPAVNDVEDYLVRFERSPMRSEATRLRDKLRLNEANAEHTIRAYEEFKSKYKTTEFVKAAQDSIFSIAYKSAVSANTIDAFKSFLEAYPDANQKTVATEKLIDLEWRQAEQMATIEAYRTFVLNYPSSKYMAQAEDIIENLEWAGAIAGNTVEAFYRYLEMYPKGNYANDANVKLDILFWDYMEEKQTIESIRQFIAERPNSTRISEAKVKLEEAIWSKADKSKSEADLRAYVQEFAAGKYLQKALVDLESSVWIRINSLPTIDALEAYIVEFGSGGHRSEAEAKLEDLYWGNALSAGTPGALESFIQKYPLSKHKDQALDRIDDLKNFVLPYLNNNHKYQLYNVSQSKFVNNEEYEDMLPTSAKSFVVKQFNKFGVVSKSGEIILPVKFDCMSFDGTFYQAEISGKIALMGLKGEEINSTRFSSVSKLNNQYYAVYDSPESESDESKCSLMDMKGEILLPFDYTFISDFKINKETVSYIAAKGGLQYLMSTDLKVLSKGYTSINNDYNNANAKGNELYIFVEGGKFGVMNALGKPIIAAGYDEISFLQSGLFSVAKTGKRGVIKIDNSFVLPLGNFQYINSLSSRFLRVSLANAKNQYPFYSKVYDLQKQRFISELSYEEISLLSSNVFEVSKDNRKYIMNEEGKVILTIDEFTNSTLMEMTDGEGDGYGEGDMGEDGENYCYPNVTGLDALERVFEPDNSGNPYYKVYYYVENKGSFVVYLDTTFKVINQPEDKYSKLLGKDLSFGSYVPALELLFAYDKQYNQYVFDLKKGTKNKYDSDFSINDFYPGYYRAYWKDAFIYYPGLGSKALVGDKVDFSRYNASKSYNDGISLYFDGDYNGAINKFRDALKVFPTYADAYYQMGLCYASMNNNYDAQKNYKEAIRLEPRNSYYIETLYEVLYGLRDWDGMLNTARSALSSGKEGSALDYFYMGLAYHSKQLNGDAINAYTRALELDSYLAAAYHNRGLCHMNNGKYDAAIKDITIGLGNCKYCSSDILANYNQNLGDAYNLNGDKSSACRYWQKAYKLSSKYNKYLYNGCK
jgi:outer membrane protein assembly factor BamD (BamD/ComL family)